MITNFELGEMIMIKAVLFDFDGVLTIDKTGSTSITNYLSNICGIPLEDVKACYYKYNKQLLLGETTHLEIWQDFCKSLGHNIDYLAYPYGRPSSVSYNVCRLAAKIGYVCAFGTIDTTINDISARKLFYLPRIVSK